MGKGHWDFENGPDAIVFNDLATIGQQEAVVSARSAEQSNPATGRKRVAVTYPIVGGFVPLGARRPDGTPHPAAGTGFGFSQALCSDLNDEGYFAWSDPFTGRWYAHQFAYDGSQFRVAGVKPYESDAPCRTADGTWVLTEPGMSRAIADGGDLLYAANAKGATREVTGVCRWRFADGVWHPVVLNQAADGTPYIAANHPDSFPATM